MAQRRWRRSMRARPSSIGCRNAVRNTVRPNERRRSWRSFTRAMMPILVVAGALSASPSLGSQGHDQRAVVALAGPREVGLDRTGPRAAARLGEPLADVLARRA